MEAHVQTCQKCQCTNLKNTLWREQGEPDKVFVECNDCGELVARYIIAQGGYYHHLRGFSSFIRGLSRSGEMMSGTNLQKDFENIQKDALSNFEKAKEVLKIEGHKV